MCINIITPSIHHGVRDLCTNNQINIDIAYKMSSVLKFPCIFDNRVEQTAHLGGKVDQNDCRKH